jgi:hypothetical protein
MLILALPIIAYRLLGVPLVRDLLFEASIIYLPLTVLILLTLYQKRRSTQAARQP